ncbi:MAG: DUF4056 domain-containing protein [Deltaproteobacteria bacterium]|nr:DUF4056 domain-containing protein [Deltaproteobacteria bacterium]
MTSAIRAPDVDLATALGDTSSEDASELAAADIPEIALPHAVRPCCVFGTDLEVAIGVVPVPGVELGNLLGPDDLGAHRYDNGFLSMQPGDPRGRVSDEKNGLVYTCRGGFIDVAHVRDNADITLAIAAGAGAHLETGSTIEVPPQAPPCGFGCGPSRPRRWPRMGASRWRWASRSGSPTSSRSGTRSPPSTATRGSRGGRRSSRPSRPRISTRTSSASASPVGSCSRRARAATSNTA